MKRREFISGLAGAALGLQTVARAQHAGHVAKIGLLLPAKSTDPEFQARVSAFVQGLQHAGWTDRRNAQLEFRWSEGNPDNTRKHATELVALAPDVILADGAGSVAALLQSTRTVPIVFPVAGDPVGAGFVATLAKPGGNVTGFLNFEYSIGAKWLEFLREIAPTVNRVIVLRDPEIPTGTGQFGVIQAAASSLKWDVYPSNPESQSCSRSAAIPSNWELLRAWRGRAEISPGQPSCPQT